MSKRNLRAPAFNLSFDVICVDKFMLKMGYESNIRFSVLINGYL